MRCCRECGCLDEYACLRDDDEANGYVTCEWIAEDLCSACVTPELEELLGWAHPPRAVTDDLAELRVGL